VLSPSTRANDEGVKRELYIHSGVHELWLVDPDARTVTRVRLEVSPDEVLDEGSTLTSDLLNGFAIEIASIFTLASNLADGGSPDGDAR
jgi:Uma2 family endonuclease